MEMTKDEIVGRYRQSKEKMKQVSILAQLNNCKAIEIVDVLVEAGFDRRNFNRITKKYKKTENKQEEKKMSEEYIKITESPIEDGRVKELSVTIENLKKEMDNLKKDSDKAIEALHDKNNELRKENAELKAKLEARYEAEMDAEVQNDGYSDALLDARNEIEELEKTNEELSNSLNDESWKRQKAEKRLRKCERYILDLVIGADDDDDI